MATKKKAPAAKAPAKKAPAKKSAATPVAKKAPAQKPPAKKASVKKSAARPVAKKAPAQKASGQKAPAQKASGQKAPAKKASVKKSAARPVAKKAPEKKKPTAPPTASSGAATLEIPAPRGVSKEGIAYTKDFDVKFLKAQWDLLLAERARLLGQAVRLEDEAHQLIEEAEMGDVQFDDEGGEGDTMVVERERDLALSAQARETIDDIDRAIARISEGTYGYSTTSGSPIPRERLEAIPWATELVSEKVGGIGRR